MRSEADSKGYDNIQETMRCDWVINCGNKNEKQTSEISVTELKRFKEKCIQVLGFPDGSSGEDPRLPMQQM